MGAGSKSLDRGAEPALGHPSPSELAAWDPSIETVTTDMLARECGRASEALASRVGGFDGGTISCFMGLTTHERRVLTSHGTDLRSRQGP